MFVYILFSVPWKYAVKSQCHVHPCTTIAQFCFSGMHHVAQDVIEWSIFNN